MRIFILLGISGVWVYGNLLGNYPRLGIKVSCYLVDSQTSREFAGEIGENWMIPAED